MKNNELSKSTRKIIKAQHRQEPLLSNIDVKMFLLSIGFKASNVLLINRRQQNVWLARGIYERKKAIFTIDFFAQKIRQHKQSPLWVVACPLTKIIIRKKLYHINEVGADIFLVEDSQ